MKDKLVQALNLTYTNAVSLYADAELLEKSNRIQRAFTLYHISFEEAGRFSLILKNLIKYFSGQMKARELNYGNLKKQGYEDHIEKLKESVLYMFKLPVYNTVVNSDESVDFLEQKYNQFLEDIPTFNRLKNDSLYITFDNNAFKSPIDSINEDSVYQIKTFAEIQIDTMKKFLEWVELNGGISAVEKAIKEISR